MSVDTINYEITGTLRDAVADSDMFPGMTVIRGHVYDDSRGRFDNGEWIRTSYVISEKFEDDHSIVFTRNSVYKVYYHKTEDKSIFHHTV